MIKSKETTIPLARPSTIRKAIQANLEEQTELERQIINPAEYAHRNPLKVQLAKLQQGTLILNCKLRSSIQENEKENKHTNSHKQTLSIFIENANSFNKRPVLKVTADTYILDKGAIIWLIEELSSL